MAGTGERGRRSTVHDSVTTSQPKKAVSRSAAWREARELVWTHRRRLSIGLSLMLVSRIASMAAPLAPQFFIDEVVTNKRVELLTPIVLIVLGATAVQAVTSFVLSQILGVAAQRAITDMRKRVQAHVMRLPVRYFDSTQTGVLISRIMSDAEGIRNLVGTGLVQLVGGFVSAGLGLAYLVYLNWHLTLITIVVLAAFGGGARCGRCSVNAGKSTPK
jgi:ABC-type bacteriocin/lantibiotic exporter with double-glycine peptidase domain